MRKVSDRGLSIKLKISAMVVLGIVFLSFLLAGISFVQTEKMGTKMKGEEAFSILKSIQININGEKFKQLADSKDANDSYYEELREYLLKVKEATGLKFLYTMVKSDKDFMFVVDGNKKESEDFSNIGDIQLSSELNKDEVEKMRAGTPFYTDINYSKTWKWLLSAYIPIKDSNGEVVGLLGADFAAEKVKENSQKTIQTIGLSAAIFCILMSIVVLIAIRRILVPLKELSETIKVISSGDLTAEINNIKNDEIGEVKFVLKESIDGIKNMITEIKSESVTITDNSNMVFRASEETAAATQEITNTISNFMEETAMQSKMAKDISNCVVELQKNTKNVIDKIENSQNKADKLKENTNKGVQLLFGKMSEIEVSIHDTSSTVTELNKNMQEIRNFLETINKISEQTNLLALNAAIEAARAGEHGRGFAVVADEVRKLAEESKSSVDKISTIIDNMNKGTKKVVTSIDKSVNMVKEGTIATQKTNQELEQTNSYISEIKKEIDEISDFIIGLNDMMMVINEKTEKIEEKLKEFEGDVYRVAGASEEQQREMEELKKLGETLNGVSNKLKASIGKFIV